MPEEIIEKIETIIPKRIFTKEELALRLQLAKENVTISFSKNEVNILKNISDNKYEVNKSIITTKLQLKILYDSLKDYIDKTGKSDDTTESLLRRLS